MKYHPYQIYYLSSADAGWYYADSRGNIYGPFSRPSLAEANARQQSKDDRQWDNEHTARCGCGAMLTAVDTCSIHGKELL